MIGAPLTRADGRLKVTGGARYAADTQVEGVLHGMLVSATIARGRLSRLDTAMAEVAPGVVRVFTHRNMPRIPKLSAPPAGESLTPMQDDQIRYEGQFIALVVAETLEQARHAAELIETEYTREVPLTDFMKDAGDSFVATNFAEPETNVGDVSAGLDRAEVRVDGVYHTADRHHNAMEPSATVAVWEDDRLTVHDATQWSWAVQMVLSQALGLEPERIRVQSPFTGGGFGCKGYVWPHQIFTAAAARELGRPLKVVLTRAQAYTSHGYQAASEQRVALGATRDGRLTAIRHTSLNPTSMADDYVEYCAISSRSMYACPAIETRHRVVRVNRGTPTAMRAPHEGPSNVGLEIAMDELAYSVGIDPLELRLRNYADGTDPTSGKAHSSKALRECYRRGAEIFGWVRRDPAPRSMREGRSLVGWGMATALMSTFRFPSSVRLTLEPEGTVLIESSAQEIGTGVYTIMPQIAAAVLGISPDRMRVVLGDTSLPVAGPTTGSSTTMGLGSAVHLGAVKLRQRLAELGRGLESAGSEPISLEVTWTPGASANALGEVPEWSMHSFGALFVEVRIDEELFIPRLSRCVGVYSAGKIINPRTAKSQMTGGMIWGAGQALLEHSAMDHTLGRYLSKNLAGYLVPVSADIPELVAEFVEEFDQHASVIGARGIGELGAVGVGAAVANAVYHATGTRVRSLPITPEALLQG